MDWDRPLTEPEQRVVDEARRTAFLLYEGRVTPHRSCGIAMAETFGRNTPPYQALRRGGITGTGPCGVVMAGRLILGEYLGDPSPTGATTPALKTAMEAFEARYPTVIDRGDAPGTSVVCNHLTAQFDDFRSPARASFCTHLASDLSGLLAEILIRSGVELQVSTV